MNATPSFAVAIMHGAAGGRRGFQAVKLQRPARATVCSHGRRTRPPATGLSSPRAS